MARKDEAEALLRQGLPPSKIARRMSVTLNTVMGYLYRRIGEGAIRRSDILFSIDKSTRENIEKVLKEQSLEADAWDYGYKPSLADFKGVGVDSADVSVYLQLRDARAALGDMYEIVRDIEITMHDSIQAILYAKYQEEWWERGIPEKIRIQCVETRKRDPDSARYPYSYTTLTHLRQILDLNWPVFWEILGKALQNKQAFLSHLSKMNQIRNRVMHPVRDQSPTEEDFLFVREFYEQYQLTKWEKYLRDHKLHLDVAAIIAEIEQD